MQADVRLQLRPDLRAVSVHFGRTLQHVISDPVSGRFFHLDPREWGLLQLLNGRRSLEEVLEQFKRRHPDETLTEEALLQFLAETRQNGLLLRAGAEGGVVPAAPASRRSLMGLRIPLFNPDRWLARCDAWLPGLFSPLIAIAWLVLVGSAIALGLFQWEAIRDRLPETRAWFGSAQMLWLPVVIVVCKIVHELAHALMARRFGVRVQECGVLFFLMIPCFYCDVSQAWLVRPAWQRMLISGAGMLAELGLAAIAAWIWWFSYPGPVQSISFLVMTSCSINTLLLNGNPLMRFDGYFLLVDLWGMPNLAARSRQWWQAVWRHLVWGLPWSAEPDDHPLRLAVYGVASFVYRWIVLASLAWFVCQVATSWGLGRPAVSLVMLLVLVAAVQTVRSAIQPVLDVRTRRWLNRESTMKRLGILFGIGLLVSLVPWPRSVTARGVIDLVDPQPVFVQAPGRLVRIKPAGQPVQSGEAIAELESLPARRELVELETQRAIEASQLDSVTIRQTFDPEAGRARPALVESLAALDERLAITRHEVSQLTVTAPHDGMLFPPLDRPAKPVNSREVADWTGTPFDPENLGCHLQRGTLLARIADGDQRTVLASVPQHLIERIAPDQSVTLLPDGANGVVLTGTVISLAAAPVERLPAELVAEGDIPVRAGSNGQPVEPCYLVQIRLHEPAGHLVPGLTGSVRIHVQPASLLTRFIDLWQQTFRIDVTAH